MPHPPPLTQTVLAAVAIATIISLFTLAVRAWKAHRAARQAGNGAVRVAEERVSGSSDGQPEDVGDVDDGGKLHNSILFSH
jgi:hypothetical protein